MRSRFALCVALLTFPATANALPELLPDDVVPVHYDLSVAPDPDTLSYRGNVGILVDVKRPTSDGSWEHETVRLKPLNPEYEAWDLRPDEFRVLGEFVGVLPAEE